QVSESFESYRRALQRREEVLLRSVQDMAEKKSNVLRAQLKSLELYQASLDSLLGHTKKTLDEASSSPYLLVSFLALKPQIVNGLQRDLQSVQALEFEPK